MYPDLAAIVGRRRTTCRGPGVGPGYASKWLSNEYGSWMGGGQRRQDHRQEREALRSHLSQVLLNRQINQLVTDLELPLTIENLQRLPIDRTRVHEVFDALQFRVLRERLFEEPEAEGGDRRGHGCVGHDGGIR